MTTSRAAADSDRATAAARARARIAAGERPDDQRAVSAEHEAAHALAYIVLGCGVHYAEIEPNMFTQATPEPTLRDPWTLAVVSIAGTVVEDSYRPRPLAERIADLLDDEEDDPDDDLWVFRRLPELAESAYQQATAILTGHAAEHAEIADALYTHGRLTRADVAALPLSGTLLARMEVANAAT